MRLPGEVRAIVPVDVAWCAIAEASVGYRGRLFRTLWWASDLGVWTARQRATIGESVVATGVVRAQAFAGLGFVPPGPLSAVVGAELRNRRVPAEIDLREGGTLRPGLRGQFAIALRGGFAIELVVRHALLPSSS